jgi:diguanylate cyclase (GGDEF)-like protein
LHRALRTSDLICRYGGEEFCVLLTGVDESIARMLAERIRARVEHDVGPGVREVPQLRVTVSVGVAERTADAASLETLIASADQALYAAKNAGRNRVALGPDGRITSAGDPPLQGARDGDRVPNP